MENQYYIYIIGIVALPLIWFLVTLAVTYIVPAEKSGRAFLRQKIRAFGADVSQIPDIALNEIVKKNIKHARTIARFSNDSREKNWRANLVRSLEMEAQTISLIISGQIDSSTKLLSGDSLTKYGIIKK